MQFAAGQNCRLHRVRGDTGRLHPQLRDHHGAGPGHGGRQWHRNLHLGRLLQTRDCYGQIRVRLQLLDPSYSSQAGALHWADDSQHSAGENDEEGAAAAAPPHDEVTEAGA